MTEPVMSDPVLVDISDFGVSTLSVEPEALQLQRKIWDIMCPKMYFECPILIKELGQSMFVYFGAMERNKLTIQMASSYIPRFNPPAYRYYCLHTSGLWKFVISNAQERIDWIDEMIPALGVPDEQEMDIEPPWTDLDKELRREIQGKHTEVMVKGLELLNKLNENLSAPDLAQIAAQIEPFTQEMLQAKKLIKMLLVKTRPLFVKILEDEKREPVNIMRFAPPEDAQVPERVVRYLIKREKKLREGPSRFERFTDFLCKKLGIENPFYYVPNHADYC